MVAFFIVGEFSLSLILIPNFLLVESKGERERERERERKEARKKIERKKVKRERELGLMQNKMS